MFLISCYPTYNDYSSLLGLALGFNLVYFGGARDFARKAEGKPINATALLSFYYFLNKISNFVLDKANKEIERKINKINELLDVNSPLNNGLLQKLNFLLYEGYITIRNIESQFGNKEGEYVIQILGKTRKIVYGFSEEAILLKNKLYKKIDRFSGTRNLQIIAAQTSIYSFLVMLIAPYEKQINNFNAFLLLINVSILFTSFLLYFLEVKIRNKDIMLKKSKLIFRLRALVGLLPIVLLLCGLFGILIFSRINFFHFNDFLLFNNYWLTVLICFWGFILYFMLGGIASISPLFRVLFIRNKGNKLLKEMGKIVFTDKNMDYINIEWNKYKKNLLVLEVK